MGWKAGHIEAAAEQRTGKWLRRKPLRLNTVTGSRNIEIGQRLAGKVTACNTRHRKDYLIHQRAIRRISPNGAPPIKCDPDETLGVDAKTVGEAMRSIYVD